MKLFANPIGRYARLSAVALATAIGGASEAQAQTPKTHLELAAWIDCKDEYQRRRNQDYCWYQDHPRLPDIGSDMRMRMIEEMKQRQRKMMECTRNPNWQMDPECLWLRQQNPFLRR